jgi:site-specific recombinase XerD
VEVDHGVGAHAKALLPDETLYHEDIATIQIYTRVAKKRKAKVISKVFDTDELPE